MEELRKRLSEKRLTNVDAQGLGHELWFVPSPAINQIVDKTAISSIADATNLPIDKDRDFAALIRKDLKKDIHDKAKVTFAISCYVNPHCLRHIQRLICHGDNKESKNIDRLLPLSKSTLSKCGFDTHDADLFFKAQWHFIAPKIQLGTLSSKHFPQERILPFQAVEEDGMPPPETGAFGKVVKLHVTPGHQEEPPYNGTVSLLHFVIYCIPRLLMRIDSYYGNSSRPKREQRLLLRRIFAKSFAIWPFSPQRDTRTLFNYCWHMFRARASISSFPLQAMGISMNSFRAMHLGQLMKWYSPSLD